jgi:hypothetical protein
MLLAAGALAAQQSIYICPMDRDVNSAKPGVCPRCGMKMTPGDREPVEYPVDMAVKKAGRKADSRLEITVRDPRTHRSVIGFLPVHEKLFHLFVVSEDLEFFVHEHPVLGKDGRFRIDIGFPRGGLYRAFGDFYPDGGSPQTVVKSIVQPGGQPAAWITHDDLAKQPSNLRVELTTVPPQPAPGVKTMLFFRVSPAEGLEPYLGAWGHLFTASDDLIDLIHTHPFAAEGAPEIQFNVIFPRARTYRVWAQFQRNGAVSTARFDVPVTALR